MGIFCSAMEINIPPPLIVTTINHFELKQIYSQQLNIDTQFIFSPDRLYGLYSNEDLVTFLKNSTVNVMEYKPESFDCDDFANVLKGEERKWFSKIHEKVGSTFGVLWGDLRKPNESQKPWRHAMNCVIDSNKEVWLIEPQDDTVSKLTPNSTVEVVFC
jgi:hypothetical protein